MLIHFPGQATSTLRIHWHVHRQWMKNRRPIRLLMLIHLPLSKLIMLAN
uniref:Uncharacterized protein n=1 Tax=Arundo donax TaxID=35708 RepID=A0A0A8XMS6_ARUDO